MTSVEPIVRPSLTAARDHFRQALRHLFGLLRWGVRAMLLMHRVQGERAALQDLDATQLADIGLDPYTARREALRAPWDLKPPR